MSPYTLPWLYVIGGISCSSLAQICIKQATNLAEKEFVWAIYLLSSILFYGLSFIAYYLALKEFPISRIAPIMTIGVVMIIVCYGFLTGETIYTKQLIGLAFGAVSIFLILS